jgi:hypothetical protein
MNITVNDLLELIADLILRTYGREGGEAGEFDHSFESTGEWSSELLCELGVAAPIDGSRFRFRILPRAEWPPLGVTVQVVFWRTPHGGTMEARGPISTAEIALPKEDV